MPNSIPSEKDSVIEGLFSVTIFLSAFLLFQIQLITAKWVLPWFGGSPSVWTTCMLFYQLVLLLGYGYAHFLSRKIATANQSFIHLTLLLLSISLMVVLFTFWKNPILPGQNWRPYGDQEPLWTILYLLLLSIGLPFLLLSSTSPLLQRWLSAVAAKSPYRLYALSNAGSLLALIAYPFLVEPYLNLKRQSMMWVAGYVLFIVSSAACSLRMKSEGKAVPERASESALPVQKMDYVRWIGLSACGSLMLLAATNQICREVAVIPLLWILPLIIYLLTFIMCFERERMYSRAVFQLILVPVIVLAYLVLSSGVSVPILHQILVFSLVLFTTCMICHGELYRSRPPVQNLTAFYVSLAAGGAVGGLFSAIAAPFLMKGYWELHLGLWLTAFLLVVSLWKDKNSWLHTTATAPAIRSRRVIQITLALGALAFLLIHQIAEDLRGSIFTARNFYGVLTVLKEDEGTRQERFTLRHGRIRHGFQFTNAERETVPTSYYGIRSGIGKTLQRIQDRGALHVGIVGLGVGTIAAYGKLSDSFRFYEIDQDVAALAQSEHGYFRYLKNTPAQVEVMLGDGRISLERELQSGSQNFDLLAIDAFNSDSIPAHLLTVEAMEIYMRHLKEDSGILAFHISNRFLDLRPVVFGLAKQFKLKAVQIDAGTVGHIALSNTWIILSQSDLFQSGLYKGDVILWSDDYHSILPVLKYTTD